MSAAVIKARNRQGPAPVVTIKREVHEASLRARQILEEAQSKALQVVADAHREEAGIRERAAQQGYAEGLDQWNDALAEAWKSRQRFLARNEPELVRLAVAVAAKIIGREVQTDPEIVLHTVRTALHSIRGEKKFTIQVNPAEEDEVRGQIGALQTLVSGLRELAVVGNSAIAPGGCTVESELGIVDAQLCVQLASLEKALLRRFSEDRS